MDHILKGDKELKKYFVILISITVLCILLTGCEEKNKKTNETESKEESVTETVTIQITTESTEENKIIAQGQGQDIISTDTDAVIEKTDNTLPDTVEPLNDGSVFDPTFTNLSIMNPNHYNREAIMDAVLNYMYKEGMSDDICTKINIDQNNCYGGIVYKITLSFQNNEDKEVTLMGNNRNNYSIQAYINPDDAEVTPDD